MNGAVVRRLVLLVLLFGAAVWVASHRDQFDIDLLEQWVSDAGMVGVIGFMLLFAVATVLLVPGSLFTLTGGVLFGPLLGTLFNLVGATVGAAAAFLIARYIAADWVAEKSRGRVKRLIDGVEAEGWHFVAFVRLVPVFPFFLLNYALGVTRIGFVPYLVTTFVCSLPSIGAITYLGYVGREAVAGQEALVQKLLIALGLLAVSAFLPRFVKRWGNRGGEDEVV